MDDLRFRQVHLDFHTSPDIPGIGSQFDRQQWQAMLKKGHINSITCFSCCHHGWSYHPATVGVTHPHLKFNLLREQIDAAHEINVKTPVYVTGGFNERIAALHPEWRHQPLENQKIQVDPFNAYFKRLCFNTDYLDYLCNLLQETVRMFPDADGIFIDIISQPPCACTKCVNDMLKQGLDPKKPEDQQKFTKSVLLNYYRRTTEAIHAVSPDMPVFHNSGHVTPGNRAILPYFSHLELESLPTGGWGYDHFPMSAAYSRTLDMDFLGMTGKFHNTWGEFGGFKHPNALRYECAAMIAEGAKCSIGDQLHPTGKMDESTYGIIGAAYEDVEQKEPWCRRAKSATNVAVLSGEAFGMSRAGGELAGALDDVGVSRFLLESHIPFDILDQDTSWNQYDLLVLPDSFRMGDDLKKRLDGFMARGGKVVLAGTGILKREEDALAMELPVTYCGTSPYVTSYIQPAPAVAPAYLTTPFVMNCTPQRVRVSSECVSLGDIYDPYFNRDYMHFCSHQHTPYQPEASGYAAGFMTQSILYFSYPVFSAYARQGNVGFRHFLWNSLKAFAGDILPVETNLPSQARVTLMKQPEEHRYVMHLLYASTILRGFNAAETHDQQRSQTLEVIEELLPLKDVKAAARIPEKVTSVTLEPQGITLPVQQENGRYRIEIPEFTCHQMVVFHC